MGMEIKILGRIRMRIRIQSEEEKGRGSIDDVFALVHVRRETETVRDCEYGRCWGVITTSVLVIYGPLDL